MEISFGGSVMPLAVSPDLGFLACWSLDGVMSVVEIETSEKICETKLPDDPNAHLAWDRQSSRVAIGKSSGHISILNRDGEEVGDGHVDDVALALDFNWSGDLLAVSLPEAVQIMDCSSMSIIDTLSFPDGWPKAVWASDGIAVHREFVLTRSANRDPTIWSLNGEIVARLARPEEDADGAIWNDVEVGCWDDELRIWSVPNWELKVEEVDVPMKCWGFIPRVDDWLMITRDDPKILKWAPIEN